ncbi:MAG TPA: hypothetical protein VFS53_05030 [Gemmatimonadota bacterium]|nr:hypothetical protein [Gemmatimonadota bacterium]
MNSILCNIRRNAVVQVTKPPQSSWRFHWHELFPVGRVGNGSEAKAVYLPAVEPGLARRALCSRLREALVELQPRPGSSVVVEGYVVQLLEDGGDFLPPTLDDDLDAMIASIVPGSRRGPQPSMNTPPLSLSA